MTVFIWYLLASSVKALYPLKSKLVRFWPSNENLVFIGALRTIFTGKNGCRRLFAIDVPVLLRRTSECESGKGLGFGSLFVAGC